MASKESRLKTILKDGKTLILAFDHGVEHGPAKYDGVDLDPKRIARIAVEGKVNGIIVHSGVARIIKPIIRKIPLIIKLTARTSLSPEENEMQELVTTVEEAKILGATAVAFSLYVGAGREAEMIKRLSEVKLECLRNQIPLLGFAYPRSRQFDKYDPTAVRYAARVGAEFGFDVVKTYYTGDPESFSKVVKDAGFVPVVAAGGPKLDDAEDVIKAVEDVMKAGAAGVAIGRNIWTRDDKTAVDLLKEIRKTIIRC